MHVLRDQLGLTGTHIGCDTSQCGACTVLIDGRAVKSCTVLAVQAEGAEITTIEGLGANGLHPLQQAFWEKHGLQCGFCTPGMILTAVDLLAQNPDPHRGGDPARPPGESLPLHRLPEHRRRHLRAATVMRQQPSNAAHAAASPATRPASRERHASRSFGSAIKRREDPRLITGQRDVHGRHPAPAHALRRRAPQPVGARARDPDRRRARPARSPGVVAVYTGRDLEDG